MAIIIDSGTKSIRTDLKTTAAVTATRAKAVANIYDPYGKATATSWEKLLGSITQPPSSGGTGGGGGGGGGYDFTDPNAGSRIRDDLIFWFGEPWVQANTSVVAYHLDRKSTPDDVRRYAVDNGANGFGMQQIKSVLSQSLSQMLGGTATSALPDSFYRTLIRTGAYENQTTLQTSIMYLKDIDWTKAFSPDTGAPLLAPFFDMWEDMTAGANFGPTAMTKLRGIVARFGYGSEAVAEWTRWMPTTYSAKSGNYGAEVRQTLQNTLQPLLGRALTEKELSPDGPLWDKNQAALLEWAKGTPEYQTRFAGKPAGMSEQAFLAEQLAWDTVYRRAFGSDTSQASGLYGGTVQLSDAGRAMMEKSGFSTFTEWEASAGGGPGWFEKNALDSGWITKGTASAIGVPSELMAWAFENGVGPDEWFQSIQWHEEAIVAEGVYDPILMRTMGIDLSSEDWYKFTSKAIGWGETQLKILEAQNRSEFREFFRNYTGHDPSVTDYDYLVSSFVSPTEYARRMAAKESAAEMLDSVNELMTRVYGTGVTLPELENLAMGGQGSGSLRAQLDQAARLDQYRATHKLTYGTDPTPTDYAAYAGYAGPEQLKWEINLAEDMGEFAPDIRETWKKVYNEDITDEQLRTLLGNMAGSGDLKYKLKQAKQVVGEEEQKHEAGFSTPTVSPIYGAAEQGGPKINMGGIKDMGA